MQIEITRSDSKNLLPANKLKWDLFIRKQYKLWIIYFAIGIVFLLMGAASKNIWNFFTSFSLLFLVMGITFVYQTINSREKTIESLRKSISLSDFEITISVNDSVFIYEDSKSYSELKWTFFSGYKIYKDYLFLVAGNNLLSSFSICKNELSPKDFEELHNFVSHLLPEWK